LLHRTDQDDTRQINRETRPEMAIKRNRDGFQNCGSSGSVGESGANIGGMFGYCDGGSISKCQSSTDVVGTEISTTITGDLSAMISILTISKALPG